MAVKLKAAVVKMILIAISNNGYLGELWVSGHFKA
jgi:hypothetical protein